ncbi:MAG: hypothetical protein ACLUHC_02625 [Clostridia bacterium]|nr:hypothetical protein [bacterium]
MKFIIILVVLTLIYIFLKIVFSVKIKKLKQFEKDEYLDKVVSKYPENTQICEEILKKVNNNTVKIEEDPNANTTLYLVMSNKIFIANLNKSYTRIQTIAHECLHSIQDKKILWSNFIFSNIYLIYFVIIAVLGILKILPYKMLFLAIFLVLGLVYYSIRTYLENDAMIKARFLAKEYMEEKGISSKDEIESLVKKYDELNDIGIKFINFKFFEGIIIKAVILSFIFMIF